MAAKKPEDLKPEDEELEEDSGVEDDSPDEPDTSKDDSKLDDDEETEDESDKPDEPAEPSFEKKFTQFQGDTPEEYFPNLEKAYDESSKEALRLKAELDSYKSRMEETLAKIARDPSLADKLADQDEDEESPTAPISPVQNPALAWAESQMKEVNRKEFDSFVEDHPELQTDPALSEKVLAELSILSEATWRRDQRVLGMGEGLRKAWISLGLTDSQEETNLKAKDTAASGKTPSKGKKVKTDDKSFTPKQIKVARRLLDPEGKMSEAELTKALAEYN